jgi:hypothetical protein
MLIMRYYGTTSEAAEKLRGLMAVTDFLLGIDLSKNHARKRSEAGGDVQLFNLGATNSDGSPGTADSRAG